MPLLRQHLIDPEICIRCNTCEETCPIGAVTHNNDNYVVDASICNFCLDCIAPCPTGAIDNWRVVRDGYGIDDQFSWSELPRQEAIEEAAGEIDAGNGLDEAAADLLSIAHQGEGGKSAAPASAAKPQVNLYNMANPAVARVTGNFRITAAGAESDVRHIVLEFGAMAFPVLEGQCIGVLPPGTDGQGKPHRMRLYSIASARDGERPNHNNVALTVKREVGGVASNYLCDLAKDGEVRVTGPYGATFLHPDAPSANIIMICTGTGSAPFRAFTERRRRAFGGAPGKLMLFFGARTPDELPYFGPLAKVPKSVLDQELVYSRLGDQPKEYVQDRLRKRGDDIAGLLAEGNTHVFVCGLKGMEAGVNEALRDICRQHKMNWDEIHTAMLSAGRYHVETY